MAQGPRGGERAIRCGALAVSVLLRLDRIGTEDGESKSHDRPNEDQAVKTAEDAAVAGQNPAEVLDAKIALQGGFEEVADRPEDARRGSDQQAGQRAAHQHPPEQRAEHECSENAAY